MCSAVPPAPGPTVGEHEITFRLGDPSNDLRAVRLYQEVGLPGGTLDFLRDTDGTGWSLTIPRPEVDRLEYLFEVTGCHGSPEHRRDPDNPRTVDGAFGAKSVLEMPSYRAPSWLERPGPPGRRRHLPISPRALADDVPVTLWSSSGLPDDTPSPLLVVHDGPEYDSLAGLTTYASSLIASGGLPPLRVALLSPGHRDERYSADGAYTRALCLAVLPRLRAEVATTQVIGVGASLGALAMLHAQRQDEACLNGLFLQSGSFFHPSHDEHEKRFARYDRIVRSVDAVLRSGGHPSPVPTVMTCGGLEENLANNRIMARALAAQGYDVSLHEVRDVHTYTAWRDAFDPWLTGLVRAVVSGQAVAAERSR